MSGCVSGASESEGVSGVSEGVSGVSEGVSGVSEGIIDASENKSIIPPPHAQNGPTRAH